ncbi:restriction endonuclease [Brassicibacter mesophilus]|uniref:restriction endonuclease n=1 Tax=Brassicibacter mesophilus TaxID=745119 RepID=UPI003D1EEC27
MDTNVYIKKVKNKLTETTNKIRLRRYYTEKLSEGKTYIATIVDKIVFRSFITLICFLFININTKSILFSLLITFQLFILYNILAYKINQKRLNKRIEKINHVVVGEKILKDLLNKSPYDFEEYIKEILEKCGFQSIESVNRKDIDLIGTLGNQKTGIKLYQYNSDYKVSINNIRDFFLELRELDISEGIVITTSTFSKDINNFLPKLKNYAAIRLFNLEAIIKLMKKADMYPSESEIKRIILSEIIEGRPKLKNYKDTVLSKNKTLKYFVISFILMMFSRITPYKSYYKIVSYILVFIGVISIIGIVIEFFANRATAQEDNNIL